MPNAVSKTSHNVAKPAATPEKQRQKVRRSISQQYAQTVVMRQKFRLSPKPTDLFTAVIASQKQGKSKMSQITKDTIIANILKIAPDSVPIFRSMGMNCLGCAMASGETLEQACAAHGVDVDDILQEINESVTQ